MQSRRKLIILALALCGVAARAQTLNSPLQELVSSMLSGSMGAMKGFHTGAKAVLESAAQLQAQALKSAGALSQQLDNALSVYEQQYCTPGAFIPSRKVPATFVGQSFSLTFDSGSCFFDDDQFVLNGIKELNCTEPSITYISTPANFTSSYHKAAKFTSKDCRISKAFGEPYEQVLYTFDHQYSEGEIVDTNAIAAKVTAELTKLVGSISNGFDQLLGGFGTQSATAAASSAAATQIPPQVNVVGVKAN